MSNVVPERGITITGSRGFLGQVLTKTLIRGKHSVHEYDLALGHDIMNTAQIDAFLDHHPTHTIVHLAACANLNIYATDPDRFREINVIGTRRILDICNARGIRLLFASTCCCYGNNDAHPSNELSPICTTEPYAKSKREAELLILAAGRNHCCMRLATFYGPDMRAALAPAVFISRLHKDLPLQVHGDGSQTRTLTYVDDVAEGIACIVSSMKQYPIVNITTSRSVSVMELIQCLASIMNKSPRIEYVEDRPGQIYREEISADRLRTMGWSPKTSLETGLAESYRNFLDNGGLWPRA